MSDQSASFQLILLFEAALQDYERQTDIELANHPLAERLQDCDSVESITAILYEKAQGFNEYGVKEKIMKSLKNVVSPLCKLSACAKLGEVIGRKFFPMEAVYSGLGVLLSTIEGVKDGYAIIELLESIEHFLYHIDIYTEITPSVTMTEILVKILVELLSVFALATKQVRRGRLKKFVKPIGEKYNEAVVQRLNRLTQDEAKLTAVQILEVVLGLVQNMRVVINDGKGSHDFFRNALETMNQIVSDINKSKRDKLQRDVRNWLSPPDPWKNHYAARESQHRGTAEWFVQGNIFSAWKSSDPCSHLLILGKPGAGKSVLCSSIIEDIIAMQKVGMATLAFFYCDFREDQKRDLRGLLSSLLVQLGHQSDSYSDILFKFYSEHADGSWPSSDDELAGCLTDLKLPGQPPVYVIIDALDEFPNTSGIPTPRDEVLNLIELLIKSQFPNLRICVTSRPETDIKDFLDPLTFRSVSLHDQDGQKRDIEDYIKSVIYTHPKIRMWKAGHKQLAMDALKETTNGMYRWVDCQLACISDCIPERIRFSETLDETYQRSLREINKANWQYAHRLFQFVAVSFRPLRVEEAADLVALDFEAGPIPKFHEDWRLEDPVETVLSVCGSLLTIVDRGCPVVLFSHSSVKEFLTSARLAESNDNILRSYHVSMTAAHTLASQTCLGIQLHLDQVVVTPDIQKTFPLAEYSAEYLADHTRFNDVSLNVEDGLFDPSKRHFPVSLHDAAAWGLHSVVKLLVIGHLEDVHSRSLIDNSTPLHFSSKYGHISVMRFLLERGAYVTAKNKDGETPLHLASRDGQVEVVRMLVEHRAALTALNKDWETPLHVASRDGQAEVARMLVEHGAALTALNKDWETPLHVASRDGQAEVARMLVEHGAALTALNMDWETPLLVALRYGRPEVARILLEHGADPTTQNEDGDTPLHLALREGHTEVARILIEQGADVAARNNDEETPLHVALRDDQVQAVCILFDHGADPSARTKEDSETPLHVASREGQVQVARILLEHGAGPKARNKDGETPLHLALQEGHVEVACILIEDGADVSAQDVGGWTPLHLVSRDGQVEIVRLLIKHGADVSAQEEDGWTPLHLASFNNHVEITRLLIEHGADLKAKNNDNETPLQMVSTPCREEVSP